MLRFRSDSPILAELAYDDPPPTPPLSPNKVRCTFCGCEVDPIQATMGSLIEPKITVSYVPKWMAGELEIEKRVRVINPKQIACPGCSLRVQKVKYPQTEG